MAGEHYIISDLHLAPFTAATNALFCRFIEEHVKQAAALTILGDFFEVYFGPRQLKDEHTKGLVDALMSLKKSGVHVRFVAGNRDFLFTPDASKFGIPAEDDRMALQIGGESVLAMHGDTLCLSDISYQRFRAFLRALPLYRLASNAPAGLAEWVALRLREKSEAKRYQPRERKRPDSYYDIHDSAVLDELGRAGATTLVCGHIHKPQRRDYKEGKRLLVLGDWHADGAVIGRAMPGGKLELVRLTPDGIVRFEGIQKEVKSQ